MEINDLITETLVKPSSLLVRRCNPTQFPKPISSLANLNHCAIANISNFPKYHILSKVKIFLKRTFYKNVYTYSIASYPS